MLENMAENMNHSNNILLEARGLGKTFPGADQAISVLDGVDFALRAGESVSIRGESGSGKSTLLNLLSGLERADAGQLFGRGARCRAIRSRSSRPRGLYLWALSFRPTIWRPN